MIKPFTFFILTVGVYAEVGCQAIIGNEVKSCEEDKLIKTHETSLLESTTVSTEESKGMKITESLVRVDVIHLGKAMSIEREASKKAPSCPPFCIQPISIEGTKTVGELETLTFIDKLKEKKSRIIIDTRLSKFYKEETIPGAINLPYEMLMDESPYQKEVLKLLGSGKKIKKTWYFKHPQILLIFGESAFSFEASKAIKQLIKLGYPKDKILYYRGGIEAWRVAGLTLI